MNKQHIYTSIYFILFIIHIAIVPHFINIVMPEPLDCTTSFNLLDGIIPLLYIITLIVLFWLFIKSLEKSVDNDEKNSRKN